MNYSTAAGKLLHDGMIAVDRFKCAPWPEMIADARRFRPVHVHFDLECGTGAPANLESVETIRARTETPWLSVHLVCRRRDFPEINGHGDPADRKCVIERMLADLGPMIDRFGADALVLENLIYQGRDRDDYLVPGIEAAVIGRVVEQSGAGFLLDLSHARIAAHYLGIDAKQYVESLPVRKLRELHITGLAMHEGTLTDHLAMRDEDWEMCRWALQRIRAGDWARPGIVAFEYGGTGKPYLWRTDPAVIASQVPRLFEMVHEI